MGKNCGSTQSGVSVYRRDGSGIRADRTCAKELSGVSVYDEKIADMEETLTQIDNLLGDFNREIADYLDDTDLTRRHFTIWKNVWMRSIT